MKLAGMRKIEVRGRIFDQRLVEDAGCEDSFEHERQMG